MMLQDVRVILFINMWSEKCSVSQGDWREKRVVAYIRMGTGIRRRGFENP